MMEIRPSTAVSPNPDFQETPRRPAETNSGWLARIAGADDPAGSLILVGGAGLTDFRLRVAQSHARRDLLPSFWSHVALVDGRDRHDWTLYEIGLEPAAGFGAVALQNGIQRGSMLAYDDPTRFPNIAHIRLSAATGAFAKGETLATVLKQAVLDLQKQRNVVDLPALLVQWLGYAWGIGGQPNPLQRQLGVPSAVFVESVFGMVGIELTPGAASQSSCPEAIWQAARWWHEFYASEVTLTHAAPAGAYVIGQPAAAAVVEPQGFGIEPRRDRREDRPRRRPPASKGTRKRSRPRQ